MNVTCRSHLGTARSTARLAACVLVGALAALLASAAPTLAKASARPRIIAMPSVLAGNEATMLKGTGFPASTRIKLEECAKKSWILPEYPCVSKAATVKTDASGGFTTTFTVKQCSTATRVEADGRARAQKCYVGELETGEDSGTLVAAVRLTVTT